MSSHHPEPSTGWEAQDQDATGSERDSRLDRLRAPDEPVQVPDDVETTVPIGRVDDARDAGDGDADDDRRDPELEHHEAPVMAAEPEVAPPEPEPAVAEPSYAPASTAQGGDAWRDLQARFVDDPAGAVEGAVQLVRDAIEAHAGAHGSADTEDLRQAFTRLRDLHGRLTG